MDGLTSQLTHAAGADPRMVYLQARAIERDRRGSDPDHTAAGASRESGRLDLAVDIAAMPLVER